MKHDYRVQPCGLVGDPVKAFGRKCVEVRFHGVGPFVAAGRHMTDHAG